MKSLKAFLLSVVLLSALSGVTAETPPDWLWARKAGGADFEQGSSIAVDSDGNTYVTGWFEGTATFGSTTLTGNGDHEDIFVAKMDSAGNWLWAKRAGGTSYDKGWAIATDTVGNSYVTGEFTGTADFGSITLTSSGEPGEGFQDVFLAKLDSAGNWVWAIRAGGVWNDGGTGIAVDSAGSVYVAGGFEESITFGSTTLTSNSGNFIAKLDSAGNWIWAKGAGGIFESGIAVDSAGNVYVTGSFDETITFGSTTLTSSGSLDIFVAKLDSAGNWLWAKRAGGTSPEYALNIALDSFANAYITGHFGDYHSNQATFGSTTLTSSGWSDIFVAKLNSSGTWLWAKQAGGTAKDISKSIAVDSAANVYLTGCYGDGYHASLNATFGSTTLINGGWEDIFVAKLNSAGNWLWAKKAGGAHIDCGRGIALDSAGSVYVTGSFEYSGTFGYTLTSNGNWDIFVAKIGSGDPMPKTPQNLLIQRIGSNIMLNWDPVTQDTGNQPLTPDRYKIEVSENNSGWTYLITVPSPGYTHTNATTGNDRKFYRVTAVKD